jgi:hypothetical protein
MSTVTTAESTASCNPPAPPIAQRHLGLRVALIIVAIVETFDELSSFPTLFGDMSQIPGPGLGGFLIKAHIATHLPLALAALVFAAVGRAPCDHRARRGRCHDLAELYAVGGATWLEFNGIGAVETPAQVVAFPLTAACAIALAARDRRLGVDAADLALPVFHHWLLHHGLGSRPTWPMNGKSISNSVLLKSRSTMIFAVAGLS